MSGAAQHGPREPIDQTIDIDEPMREIERHLAAVEVFGAAGCDVGGIWTPEKEHEMTVRKRPSPALVVALLALFVSLSGTAVAAGVVPLAKRALNADKAKVADNAKKLEGQTAAALLQKAGQMPGPASSAAGLVSTKQVTDSLAGKAGRDYVIGCDGGRKVLSGGYSTTGDVLGFDSRPISDTSWSIYLGNGGDAAASVTLYAVCVG